MPTIRQYAYLRCRAIAHAWENYNPLRKARSGVVLSLRCTFCGMIREDVVSRATGQLVSRNYVQPKRYKDERRDRSDYRKAYLDALASKNGK